jgi:hypothetical protein
MQRASAVRGADMWMDDVKDNPVAKRFLEIAGKQRIEEQTRRTLARALIRHARKLNIDPPADTETLLANYADEDSLFEMVEDMVNMTDFTGFLKDHGIDLSGISS